MKKHLLSAVTLFCFCIATVKAQLSVNGSGGNAAGSGGSASYSVGQVAYEYVTGSSGSINQGVQQTYDFSTGINNNKDITLTMNVFPNPTLSVVNLNVDNQQSGNLTFHLYDVSGRLLLSQKITDALTVVPMQSLPAATYLLSITNSETTVKTFTIIKNN